MPFQHNTSDCSSSNDTTISNAPTETLMITTHNKC